LGSWLLHTSGAKRPYSLIVHQRKHQPQTTGMLLQHCPSSNHDFALCLHDDAEIESRKHGGLGGLTGVELQVEKGSGAVCA